MVKYRVDLVYMGVSAEIKRIEVERQTAHIVFMDGYWKSKKSDYCQFFDSFLEAKEFLLDTQKRNLKYFEDRAGWAREVLEKVEALVEDSQNG